MLPPVDAAAGPPSADPAPARPGAAVRTQQRLNAPGVLRLALALVLRCAKIMTLAALAAGAAVLWLVAALAAAVWVLAAQILKRPR